MISGFADWQRELMREMQKYRYTHSATGGGLIDAMIPFRLGWTPERTAKAMLRVSQGDHDVLCDISVRGEQ